MDKTKPITTKQMKTSSCTPAQKRNERIFLLVVIIAVSLVVYFSPVV